MKAVSNFPRGYRSRKGSGGAWRIERVGGEICWKTQRAIEHGVQETRSGGNPGVYMGLTEQGCMCHLGREKKLIEKKRKEIEGELLPLAAARWHERKKKGNFSLLSEGRLAD